MAGDDLVFAFAGDGLGMLPGSRPPSALCKDGRVDARGEFCENPAQDQDRLRNNGFDSHIGLPAKRAGGDSHSVSSVVGTPPGDGGRFLEEDGDGGIGTFLSHRY